MNNFGSYSHHVKIVLNSFDEQIVLNLNNFGVVWLVSLNYSFQCLNNIIHIFTHFFTHTYFQKIQTALLNGSLILRFDSVHEC